MSPEAAKYVYRAIINCIGGDIKEVERLTNKAIEFNKQEDKLVKCKYWSKGQKLDAYINFQSGVITNMNGEVLRKGLAVC